MRPPDLRALDGKQVAIVGARGDPRCYDNVSTYARACSIRRENRAHFLVAAAGPLFNKAFNLSMPRRSESAGCLDSRLEATTRSGHVPSALQDASNPLHVNDPPMEGLSCLRHSFV